MNDLIKNIKNLRELTGSGFLDCKKALEENDNDLESFYRLFKKKRFS